MPPRTDPATTADRWLPLTILLCVAFVAVGGAVATIGPSLPGLARSVGRPLPDLGALLSTLFAGMLLGQVSAGLLVDRFGVRGPIVVSLAGFALGVLWLPVAASFWSLLAGGLVMGLGFGMAAISVNSLASRLLPHRPGFVLNLCNVWYAGGTVVGPFLASVVLDRGGRAVTVLAVAGILSAVLVPIAYRIVPSDERAATERSKVASQPPDAPLWRPPAWLLLAGVVVALYGGVEAGFGGWVSSYVQLSLGESAARGALLTSLFWFAYLLGRIAATAATLAIGPDRVLAMTVALVLAGGIVLGLGYGSTPVTIVAIAVLGFGIGPLFPAMFALVTQRARRRPATAVSVTSAVGSVGAVVLPWVMGQALPVSGGWYVGWMPAVFGLGMVLAFWTSEWLYDRQAPACDPAGDRA